MGEQQNFDQDVVKMLELLRDGCQSGVEKLNKSQAKVTGRPGETTGNTRWIPSVSLKDLDLSFHGRSASPSANGNGDGQIGPKRERKSKAGEQDPTLEIGVVLEITQHELASENKPQDN